MGTSHQTIGPMERGDPRAITMDRMALAATFLGLKPTVAFYPTGSPVRDAAHLALLGRLRPLLSPSLRLRFEVPMPAMGDLRSADGVAIGAEFDAMIEAETHVGDVQAVIRRARAKQRDLGCRRLILLLSDSRHHRQLLRSHPLLLEEFPISARRGLRALRRGNDPGGDMILLL